MVSELSRDTLFRTISPVSVVLNTARRRQLLPDQQTDDEHNQKLASTDGSRYGFEGPCMLISRYIPCIVGSKHDEWV